MNKYIIRGSVAGTVVTIFLSILIDSFDKYIYIPVLSMVMVGIFSFEFIICLICYHHALWTNQDQTEQKSPDGTK